MCVFWMEGSFWELCCRHSGEMLRAAGGWSVCVCVCACVCVCVCSLFSLVTWMKIRAPFQHSNSHTHTHTDTHRHGHKAMHTPWSDLYPTLHANTHVYALTHTHTHTHTHTLSLRIMRAGMLKEGQSLLLHDCVDGK